MPGCLLNICLHYAWKYTVENTSEPNFNLPATFLLVWKSFNNFAQGRTKSLPCSVQIVRASCKPQWILWLDSRRFGRFSFMMRFEAIFYISKSSWSRDQPALSNTHYLCGILFAARYAFGFIDDWFRYNNARVKSTIAIISLVLRMRFKYSSYAHGVFVYNLSVWLCIINSNDKWIRTEAIYDPMNSILKMLWKEVNS